jgi:hypothetical protein
LRADIEYQIGWSKTAAHWEIRRDGAEATMFRRKKQSAIDRAIAGIQSELPPPGARAVVTSLKEGTLRIEWVGKAPMGDPRPHRPDTGKANMSAK